MNAESRNANLFATANRKQEIPSLFCATRSFGQQRSRETLLCFLVATLLKEIARRQNAGKESLQCCIETYIV